METSHKNYGNLHQVSMRRIASFIVDFLITIILSAMVASAILLIRTKYVVPDENLSQELLTAKWSKSFLTFIYPAFVVYLMGYITYKPNQTIGMKLFSIRIKKMNGSNISNGVAFAYPVLLTCIALIAPPIILGTFFSKHKHLPHDALLGTIFVRSDI